MGTLGRVTLILAVVATLMFSLSAGAQTVSFGAAPSFPAGVSPTVHNCSLSQF
jgi:hypothetical protein